MDSRRGRRHRCRRAQRFLATLFQQVAVNSNGLISLNRFDLFHGHAFVTAHGALGILFHAKEYPAYDEDSFPVDLGFCQKNSILPYDETEASMRTVLWLGIDNETSVFAYINTAAAANRVMLTVPELHTTYEGDFGQVQGDIYYFDCLRNRRISERLFIIPR